MIEIEPDHRSALRERREPVFCDLAKAVPDRPIGFSGRRFRPLPAAFPGLLPVR